MRRRTVDPATWFRSLASRNGLAYDSEHAERLAGAAAKRAVHSAMDALELAVERRDYVAKLADRRAMANSGQLELEA